MGPPEEWQASWIGMDENIVKLPKLKPGEPDSSRMENPAVMLRHEFDLPPAFTRARAYICGLGYYELRINGAKVGKNVLDPGFTDYDKRMLFVTHELNEHLKPGRNAVAVLLGGGWYDMPTPDVWDGEKAPWRRSPRLLLRLEVELADGSTQTIVSGPDWKVSKAGPIVFNSIRSGETYDARRELPGWDAPNFNDHAWLSAQPLSAPKGKISPQLLPPIIVANSLPAVKMTQPRPSVFVFDFDQCLAGWVHLKTAGLRGTRVQIKYGERLGQDGLVNQKPLDRFTFGRFQTDEYILKGNGKESWEPRFCYHAFRYVEVSGLSEAPELIAREVHSSVAHVGTFTCSNALLNRIQRACVRTFLSNIHSIPTDCPSREKQGWVGDGLFASPQALYNFDMGAFYRKWLDDMRDAQASNGCMPAIVPWPGWREGGPGGGFDSPEWGCACVVLPWQLYCHYGNLKDLATNYPMMRAYTDSLSRRAPDHIPSFGTGDWLEVGSGAWPKRTPKALTGAAFLYLDATLVSKTATLLGDSNTAQQYQDLAIATQEAFQKRFFDPSIGGYGKDSQTAQAMPLNIGLTPEALCPAVFATLVQDVQLRKRHISAGIIGVRHVLEALTDGDRVDLAYAIATQTNFPSWGHILCNGASTISEDWSANDSLNHPAFTVISAWFYRSLAGIACDPTTPGFKHIVFKPFIPAALASAEAHYQSAHGQIRSAWSHQGREAQLHLEIPANCTATLLLPTSSPQEVKEKGCPATQAEGVIAQGVQNNRAAYTLGSGTYAFTFNL